MKKRCFKCNKLKLRGDFYKHKQMADGLLGKCKECTKSDVNAHRAKNLEAIRAYDRRRYRENPVRQEQLRAWGAKFPAEKRAAIAILGRAIRDGRIKKPSSCSACNQKTTSRRLHGHHDDYTKPLKVRWLCIPCHRRHHRLEQLKKADR